MERVGPFTSFGIGRLVFFFIYISYFYFYTVPLLLFFSFVSASDTLFPIPCAGRSKYLSFCIFKSPFPALEAYCIAGWLLSAFWMVVNADFCGCTFGALSFL